MKRFEDCVKTIEEGLEAIKGHNTDYSKVAKAKARKANALHRLEKWDESIAEYNSALVEF